jgi:uncharacterized cupin superfamily protein
VKKVNIHSIELDERLDEAGFRHVATSIGSRLGAQRIGAAVYEAEAGYPIWPYHYHHGVEEWLYVIDGAPVLREPPGERTLTPGDLVRFPAGHLGAHTLKGPGRFVIFDTENGTYMSVYPDSDKVSGPEGMLLRSSAVGYWHGEGTAGSQPAEPVPVDETLGANMLEATVVEPGEPYSYVHGREQWLLVLSGTPTLRHAQGEDILEAGDVVCLPEGPAGAHQLLDRDESRVLRLSTTGLPANFHYPDTGEWWMRND